MLSGDITLAKYPVVSSPWQDALVTAPWQDALRWHCLGRMPCRAIAVAGAGQRPQPPPSTQDLPRGSFPPPKPRDSRVAPRWFNV